MCLGWLHFGICNNDKYVILRKKESLGKPTFTTCKAWVERDSCPACLHCVSPSPEWNRCSADGSGAITWMEHTKAVGLSTRPGQMEPSVSLERQVTPCVACPPETEMLLTWMEAVWYGVVYYVMVCSSTRILLRMKVWLTIEWCETILTYKPLNLSSEKGSGKLLPLSLLESKKHHDPASLVSSLLFSQASYRVCCFLLYSSMMLPGT